MIDGHSDTITKLYESGGQFYENDCHVDVKRLLRYGAPAQFFAICLNPMYYQEALAKTLEIIEFHHGQFEKNAEFIELCRSYDDMRRAEEKGKISAILAIEGLYAIRDSVELLKTFYRLGVRACNLTWNYSNALAGGVFGAWGERSTRGLTELGEEAVCLMNGLGMIIDVSHLSEKSFYDVVEKSKKPVIASHSNSYEMCKHARNLKDEQITAIANIGGTIGINYYAAFLADGHNVSVDDVLRHTEHIINVGGEDVIAIGSDFDGIDAMPCEFSDVSGHRIVLDAVCKRFGSKIMGKMAGGNMARVMKEVL